MILRVDGQPRPKGSRRSGVDKQGHVYTFPDSKYEKQWVGLVKRAALARPGAVLPGPYVVELEFLLQRPKRPTYSYPPVPDIDKLVRAVLDGLVQGGVLSDDRHVIELTAIKRYCTPDESPGVVCAVVTVPEESAIRGVA